VFNCFLGKDRTGVLAALVLSCLGVERDAIVRDYAVTDERVQMIVDKLRRDPLVHEAVDRTDPVLLAAHEATMSDFLSEVDHRFGGARSWLEAAGVTAEQIARLEELVLE
ncbi:MAG TPA: tyrosine-protein phosphatase, partial [Acidimicrobiales bacterium]|nr:tyrosine-protein phosphatase [Acidimicrobiales bacterium]